MARGRKKTSRKAKSAAAGGAKGASARASGTLPEPLPSLDISPSYEGLTSLGLRSLAEGRGEIRPADREELARLASALRRARGFALYLAECASPAYRDRLTGLLAGLVDTPPVQVNLDPGLVSGATSAVDIIALAARDAPAGAPLLAVGLESLLFAAKERANAVLRDLNLRRAVLSGLGRPLVFWLPEHAHRALAREASDLHDWYSGSYMFSAGDQGESISRLKPVASDLTLLWSIGETDKRAMIRTLESMLQERQGREDEECIVLHLQLGELLFSLGESLPALEQYDIAYNSAEGLKNWKYQAQALGHMGRVLLQLGRIEEALTRHEKQFNLFKRLNRQREMAISLNDIARIYMAKGQFDKALIYLKDALNIAEKLNEPLEHSVIIGDIARIYISNGRLDEALNLYKEQLSINEKLGNRRERGVAIGNIAHILMEKGRLDEALSLQEERLAVNSMLGDLDGIAATNYDIFQVLRAKGNYNSAAPHIIQAYQMVLKLGRLEGICVVGQDYGPFLWMNGSHDHARSVLNRSIAGFEQLGRPDQAEQTRQILAQLEQRGEGEAHAQEE